MKKSIILILIGICICQSNWEKGIGLSINFLQSKNKFYPGIGGNIDYFPEFGKINKNEFGLKYDIFISGWLLFEEIEEGDSLRNSWDLGVDQIQSIELIYRRNLAKGKLSISIIPLQSSESEYTLFGRVGYKIPLRNNYLELFLRRYTKSVNPHIGFIYYW